MLCVHKNNSNLHHAPARCRARLESEPEQTSGTDKQGQTGTVFLTIKIYIPGIFTSASSPPLIYSKAPHISHFEFSFSQTKSNHLHNDMFSKTCLFIASFAFFAVACVSSVGPLSFNPSLLDHVSKVGFSVSRSITLLIFFWFLCSMGGKCDQNNCDTPVNCQWCSGLCIAAYLYCVRFSLSFWLVINFSWYGLSDSSLASPGLNDHQLKVWSALNLPYKPVVSFLLFPLIDTQTEQVSIKSICLFLYFLQLSWLRKFECLALPKGSLCVWLSLSSVPPFLLFDGLHVWISSLVSWICCLGLHFSFTLVFRMNCLETPCGLC